MLLTIFLLVFSAPLLIAHVQIFGTHWFQGKKDGAEYSGWHTGINLQKCFKGKPLLITCWIPLQDLTTCVLVGVIMRMRAIVFPLSLFPFIYFIIKA
jgi:hypothetical protein